MSARLLASVLALLPMQAASQERPCHRWLDEVELKGTLTEAVFPGRPNFESVARGDRALTFPLLFVLGEVCMIEDPSSPFTPAATASVLQLLYDGSELPEFRAMIGSIVKVRGVLFFPSSGFHRTAILIHARTVEYRFD